MTNIFNIIFCGCTPKRAVALWRLPRHAVETTAGSLQSLWLWLGKLNSKWPPHRILWRIRRWLQQVVAQPTLPLPLWWVRRRRSSRRLLAHIHRPTSSSISCSQTLLIRLLPSTPTIWMYYALFEGFWKVFWVPLYTSIYNVYLHSKIHFLKI